MKQILLASAVFVVTCTITVSAITAQTAPAPQRVSAADTVDVYKDAH
ncbi:MAG TPA: hypothetical protein VGC70_06375 [Burkholderiales bacterium]